ncbi:DciA family protein, partial [Treponema sp.]|uniref:DciA family protein n=1 Tax=Treponema sp. TaxID=166 RepID=UPI00388CF1A7
KAELEKNNKLLKSWKYVITSIKSNAINGNNLGENLYSHSRVIDLKNEILLIESDHPGWIQTMKLYQKYILNGLKRGVPEVKISSLAFRLRGTNVQLHNQISEEKVRDEMKSKIENEDEIIRKFDEANGINKKAEILSEKKEMPENLQKILDRLKADMLTNDK